MSKVSIRRAAMRKLVKRGYSQTQAYQMICLAMDVGCDEALQLEARSVGVREMQRLASGGER